MAYAVEKKLSKHPERFGTGIIEGVAAPEGANNAAAGGAMVSLLTLGIPGSGTTAVMLGALMIHGLRPGPMLFSTHPDFVWGLIASMYIGNVMLVILNMPLIGLWVRLLKVPYSVLMPLIITISAVGVYATDNNIFDMWVMFFFGVVGYLMRKMDYPPGADGPGPGPGTDGGDVTPPVPYHLPRERRDLLHPPHLGYPHRHRTRFSVRPTVQNTLDQISGRQKGGVSI